MTKELLGTFIAQQRKALGMTQRDLAQRLHVTDKAVSKWERGLSYPDVTLLEPLAEAFGIGVEELVACKETREKEESALNAVLDISKESLRCQRAEGRRRLAGVLVLLLLTALLVLYVSLIGRVTQEHTTVFWYEAVGEEHYIYLEKEEHLLKLKCEEEVFEGIKADKEALAYWNELYYMDYTWNKRTYEGTLESCRKDMEYGAATKLDEIEVFDWTHGCIFGEYGICYAPDDYHRNPYGEGYLCDYIFWRYTEDREHRLLRINDCISVTLGDTDGDGENEIIARTYYVEKPYVIYDNTTGAIEPTYVEDIPKELKEQLICIWER